jgi:cytochrome c oxidase cbb3-type subunit I/II
MPAYPFLLENEVDLNAIPGKIRAMRMLGVPYGEGFDSKAIESYMSDAQKIVDELKQAGVEIKPTKEVIAMIAYLHKLGRDISPAATPVATPVMPATTPATAPMAPATPDTAPAVPASPAANPAGTPATVPSTAPDTTVVKTPSSASSANVKK